MSRDFSANGDEGRAYGEQGPIVEEQPPALQDAFVAAVSRVLNKITVGTVSGGAKLRYARRPAERRQSHSSPPGGAD